MTPLYAAGGFFPDGHVSRSVAFLTFLHTPKKISNTTTHTLLARALGWVLISRLGLAHGVPCMPVMLTRLDFPFCHRRLSPHHVRSGRELSLPRRRTCSRTCSRRSTSDNLFKHPLDPDCKILQVAVPPVLESIARTLLVFPPPLPLFQTVRMIHTATRLVARLGGP